MPVQVLPSVHVHPTDDMLEEYLFERVPEPVCTILEEHFHGCVECRQALESAAEFAFLVRLETGRLVDHEAPDPVWRRLWLRRVPAWASEGMTGARLSLVAAGLTLAAVMATAVFTRQPLQYPPAVVMLAAYRGLDDGVARAPARRPLELNIGATMLTGAIDSLQIVDSSGKEVWRGPVSRRENARLSARVPKGLPPGVYWARLYESSQTLVREFGLRIE